LAIGGICHNGQRGDELATTIKVLAEAANAAVTEVTIRTLTIPFLSLRKSNG
jgi:hypothetical protein